MSDPLLPRSVRVPGWDWVADARYEQAVVSGRQILTCGIAPIDADGRMVGVGDFEAQFRQVLENIHAVLASAGSDWQHIGRIQTYLTSAEKIDAFRALRDELFPTPYPASVLLVVSALAHPDMQLEMAVEAFTAGSAPA